MEKENSFFQTIDFNVNNIGSKEFLFNPSFMKNLSNKSIDQEFK